MDNKPMKKCSSLLDIREMLTKTPVCITSTKMSKTKKLDDTKHWLGYGATIILYIAYRTAN